MTDEAFGMAHGYAPSAHRVVCCDYDGTIYPWAPLMAEPDPLPGAVESLRRLKAAGYRIVIFTSRLSPVWLAEAKYTAAEQREHIERLLHRDGIPFDDVTSDKVPAEVYLDDRALRISGDWDGVADWIIFSGSGADDR